jgi:hypothetical protein
VSSRSERAYRSGDPGWYVINRDTRIAVGGPFRDQLTASRLKQGIDDRWAHVPAGRDVLVLEWVRQ